MPQVIQYSCHSMKDHHYFFLELDNPIHMAYKAWTEDDNALPDPKIAQAIFDADQLDPFGGFQSVTDVYDGMIHIAGNSSRSKKNDKILFGAVVEIFCEAKDARDYAKKMNYDIVDDWEGYIY